MPTNRSITKVVLEKVRLEVGAAVSQEMLDGKMDYFTDWMSNRIRVQVRGFLWGKEIESYELRYPLNWVEAFKERWAPAWLLRRSPVRCVTKTISLKAIYPTLRHLVPEHEPRLVLLINGTSFGGHGGQRP